MAPPATPFTLVLGLLLTIASGPQPALAATLPAEKQALQQIYQATGGASWSTKTGWTDSSGDPCDDGWYGVTCSTGGAVTSLDLSSNGLAGTLPDAFAGFGAMETFNVFNNDLTSTVPQSLADLSTVTYLALNYNGFTGSLPSSGDWSNVYYLNIRDTDIEGALPAYAMSPNLLYIYAYNTQISSIPTEIGLATSLIYLYVYSSDVGGTIPTEIGSLTSLRRFYGYTNRMEGTLPSELGDCTALQELRINYNQLTGTLSASFDRWSSLTYLSLGANQISGSLPAGLFSGAPLLQYGYFYDMELSGSLPASLGSTDLIYFQVNGNSLTGTIPSTLNWPALTNLRFGENLLTGIPTELGLASSVTYLDLADNLFTEVPSELGQMASLESLYLYENLLWGPFEDVVGPLFAAPALEILNVRSNLLSGTIPPTVGNASTTLTSLWVRSNSLLGGSLPSELGLLTALEQFGAYSCAFTGQIPSELGQLSSLLYFYVNDNELTGSIPSEVMAGMTSVQEFEAHENALTGTIPTELGLMTNLEDLTLHDNRLTGPLPTEIGQLVNCDLFRVAENLLSGTLPTEVGAMSLLYTFNVRSTLLTGTIPSQLGSLDVLRDVYMYSSGFSGQLPALCSRNSLYSLYLSENALTGSIGDWIGDCHSITTLSLGENSFSGSLPDAMATLTDLEILRLSHNEFSGTLGTIAADWSEIEEIDMGFNSFEGELDASLFALPKLIELDVGGAAFTGSIASVAGLSQIEVLRWDYNEITGPLPAGLDALPEMYYFNAEANAHSGAIPSALGGAEGLMYLYLDQNGFEGTLPDELSGLTSVRTLSAELNPGLNGSVPAGLGGLDELAAVYLSGCSGLSGTVPSELGDCPALLLLDLSDTGVGGALPGELFENGALSDLLLSNTGVSGTLPSEVALCSTLETLHIDGTALTGALPDLSDIEGFVDFNADDCEGLRGTLPADWAACDTLAAVSIRNVGLSGTLPPEWAELGNLADLDLSGNQLTGSVPAEWAGLGALESLDLTDNLLWGVIDPALTAGSFSFDTPQEPGDATQLAALADLAAFAGWNRSADPCAAGDWPGVTCDWQGFVRRLELADAGLAGVLPESLTALNATLRYADVSGDGNTLYCPLPFAVTLGGCAPLDTFVDRAPPRYSNASVLGDVFSFSTDPAGLVVEVSVDDGESWTADWAALALADGYHALQARAVMGDGSGDPDASPAEYEWLVDTTAPLLGALAAPPAVSGANASDITVGSSEDGCTMRFRVDDGAWDAQIDQLDDTTLDPPSVALLSQPDAHTNSTTARFELASDLASATFEASYDGGAWQEFVPEVADLAEGWHVALFRALDAAGLASADPAVALWQVVPLTSPVAAVAAGPPAETELTVALFEFSMDDGGHETCSFSYAVDGGPAAASDVSAVTVGPLALGAHELSVGATCADGVVQGAWASYAWSVVAAPAQSVTFSTGELAEGAHSAEVTVVDAAGNAGAGLRLDWEVDVTRPRVAIESGPGNVTANSTVAFELVCDDVHACTFDWSLPSVSLSGATDAAGLELILGDGEYELQVTARDEANNTALEAATWAFVVDSTAPNATVVARPPALSNEDSAVFEFACDDLTACAVEVDGAVAALADDAHNVSWFARDAAGNTGPTAVEAWVVDTTPPTTVVVSAPPPLSARTDVALEFGCDDAHPPCSFGNEALWTQTGLADGAYSLTARATDAANNTDPAGATVAWVVDATPPVTVVVEAPPALVASPNVSFEVDCVDNSSCSFVVSGETTGLADGAYTVNVTAVDAANNTGNTVSLSFEVDTVPPAAAFVSPTPAQVASNNVSFDVECLEGYSVWLDGGGADLGGLGWAVVADGPHELVVVTEDEAGNVDAAAAVWAFVADATAPALLWLRTPPALSASAEAEFEFGCDDGALGVGGCSYTVVDGETSGLADGNHSLAVVVADALNNTAAAETYSWFVDTQPPTTVIEAAPGELTNSADPEAEFVFGCVDALPCTFVTDSSPGLMRAWAVDAVNNTDPVGVNYSYVVDVDPPTTLLVAGPPALTSDPRPFVALACEDEHTPCSFALSTGETTDANVTLLALADGEHAVVATATDAAGNADPVGLTLAFVVDTVAPTTTTIAGALPDVVATAAVEAQFACDEANCTFAVSNDAFRASASGLVRADALADGSHAVVVQAADLAGNVDAAGLTWALVVDTAAPAISWVEAPDAHTPETSAALSFAVADLTETTCEPSTTTTELSGLAEGAHALTVACVDAAGNAANATWAWVVDLSAPALALSGAPSTPQSNERAVVVDVAVDDASPVSVWAVLTVDGAVVYSGSTVEHTLAGDGGAVVLFVEATDAAGWTGNATAAWTADFVAPEIRFVTVPDKVTGLTTALVEYECVEASSVCSDGSSVVDEDCAFRCWLDGAAGCDGAAATGLATGAHSVTVEAVDSAGNGVNATYSWLVAVDVEPVIVDGPPDVLGVSEASFALSAPQAGVEFELQLLDGEGATVLAWTSEPVFDYVFGAADTNASALIADLPVAEYTVAFRVVGYDADAEYRFEVGECATTGEQKQLGADGASLVCVACPAHGVTCVNGEASLSAGWWTPDDEQLEDVSSIDVYECPIPEACSSAAAGTNETSCAPGYTGLLCSQCADGYASSFGTCSACPEDGGGSVAFFVFIVLLVAALISALCFYSGRLIKSGTLKILVNFGHLAGAIVAFNAPWPGFMTRMFAVTAFASNIDISDISSPGCAGLPFTFYGTWAFALALPLTLVGIIVLVCRYWVGLEDRRTPTVRNVLLVLLFSYPGVSGTLCQFFNCREVSGGWYLVSDYSVACYDTTWFSLLPIALAALVVYVIGVPLGSYLLLQRHKGQLADQKTRLAVGLLYLSYREEHFCHEVFVLLFKCTLWVLSVFATSGSTMQLAGAMLFSLGALGYHSFAQPYETALRNVLAALNYAYICLVCAAGLILKLDSEPYIPGWELDFVTGFLNVLTVLMLAVLIAGSFGRKVNSAYEYGRKRRRKALEKQLSLKLEARATLVGARGSEERHASLAAKPDKNPLRRARQSITAAIPRSGSVTVRRLSMMMPDCSSGPGPSGSGSGSGSGLGSGSRSVELGSLRGSAAAAASSVSRRTSNIGRRAQSVATPPPAFGQGLPPRTASAAPAPLNSTLNSTVNPMIRELQPAPEAGSREV